MVDVVTGLVTIADANDAAGTGELAVSARHEAVLASGRRVLLLDDRGWSSSGPPDVWEQTSDRDVVRTTGMVVGPDEAFGSHMQEDMDRAHWASLVEVLGRQGVVAEVSELARLPHEVVLTESLRRRLGPSPGPDDQLR